MLTNLVAILRQAELISATQEQAVVTQVSASGTSVPEALLELSIFHAQELTEQLSHIFGLPETDLSRYDYANLCQQLGLRELITRYDALPIAKQGNLLLLAVSDRPYCKPKKNFVLPQDYKLNWHWPITARCKPRFAVCMAAQFKAQPTKGKRSAKMSSPIWLKSVTTSCNPLKISAKMTLRLAALSTKCCSMRYVKVPRIFILSRMKPVSDPPALRWHLGRNSATG